MTAHAHHEPWPGRGTTSTGHRPALRHRRTDIVVRQALAPRLQPLSVSFDKLGATAARWAHLADELAHRGHPVERTGTGPVVEVYPKAARLRWQLGAERSMDELLQAAPFLRCAPQVQEAYERDEHAFDALIAALVARACAKGLTGLPTAEDGPAAAVEGWIHLPEEGTLHSLAQGR
ncbi:DUF429 domain-containing protein [Kitasatospora sp. NPDC059648]|uniref:DUF429 domain-containing protein n=1 Tax=Kitasatospora sp. NPDC059648 TaxID=3346894 RepID=UPI0036B1EBB5